MIVRAGHRSAVRGVIMGGFICGGILSAHAELQDKDGFNADAGKTAGVNCACRTAGKGMRCAV